MRLTPAHAAVAPSQCGVSTSLRIQGDEQGQQDKHPVSLFRNFITVMSTG